MPDLPAQRWSCHSCGQCCYRLVGHLSEEERQRIEDQGWREKLGVEPYVKFGRSWVLNKRDDGACVFLNEEGLCAIHATYGEKAKPLACRIYPFSMRAENEGWRVSLRMDCPSAQQSQGQSLSAYKPLLEELAAKLPRGKRRRTTEVHLQQGTVATAQEVEAFNGALESWLDRDGLPFQQRLIGAARMSSALAQANYKKVRGDRFVELVDILIEHLPDESSEPVMPPTARQEGMLRQLAFAHAEHASHGEMRGGLLARGLQRVQQLQQARSFQKGRGEAPPLEGYDGTARFEAIAAVKPAATDWDRIENLTQRYLTARVAGFTVYGDGYYGWPLFSGFCALWLSVAAAGFLARFRAASDGRDRLCYEDVAEGIAIVDRAATRLPALGTAAERLRLSYLLADDGITRLLNRYRFVGGDHGPG